MTNNKTLTDAETLKLIARLAARLQMGGRKAEADNIIAAAQKTLGR